VNPSRDRFRLRRALAVWAFAAILVTLAATLVLIFVGGQYMGDKLLQGSGLLGPIIACLTALIWKYFGDVTQTDLEEIRNAGDAISARRDSGPGDR